MFHFRKWKHGGKRASKSKTQGVSSDTDEEIDSNMPGVGSICTLKTTRRKRRKSKEGNKHSENACIVNAFFDAANAHDYERLKRLTTTDCEIHFSVVDDDDDAINYSQENSVNSLREIMSDYISSFPDLHIIATDAIEISNDLVIANQVVFSGRHTGLPYKVGNLPLLHPMGIHVVNDLEEYIFYMSRGKIAKIIVQSDGELTGAFGFYQQVKEGNDALD